MKPLAPIILFAYKRPEQLKRVLSALASSAAPGAQELIIYCDAPRNAAPSSEIREVESVRAIARDYPLAAQRTVIERDRNFGLHDNVVSGVSEVLGVRDAAIILEDDIVVSPAFLKFMRSALSAYSGNPKVFSVTGYSPRLKINPGYPHDAYFFSRSSSWGWGTWRAVWEKFATADSHYRQSSLAPGVTAEASLAGEDLPYMLGEQLSGRINSWAVKWAYFHIANRAKCLYPVESLIDNCGFGDSATHTRTKRRYAPHFTPESSFHRKAVFSFPGDFSEEEYISAQFRKLYAVSTAGKIINACRGMFRTNAVIL